jgi:hypothetical protein
MIRRASDENDQIPDDRQLAITLASPESGAGRSAGVAIFVAPTVACAHNIALQMSFVRAAERRKVN